jgi:hypothetical protein
MSANCDMLRPPAWKRRGRRRGGSNALREDGAQSYDHFSAFLNQAPRYVALVVNIQYCKASSSISRVPRTVDLFIFSTRFLNCTFRDLECILFHPKNLLLPSRLFRSLSDRNPRFVEVNLQPKSIFLPGIIFEHTSYTWRCWLEP